MPNPGDTIYSRKKKGLTKEALTSLAGGCSDWITQLEADNGELFKNIQTYWNRYDARPQHRTRTQPWENASNVVVPVIPTFCDALTARVWGQLHTPTRTWMIRSDNQELEDMTTAVAEFMNREARTTYDIQAATYDWVNEAVVVGSSVLAVTWGKKIAYRWNHASKKIQPYQISSGPIVEHVPRENMLWERDRLIQDSSSVVRQCLYSWNDLVYYKQTADWDIDGCEGNGGLMGPAAEVLTERRRLEGASVGQAGLGEPHDIREIWIDYPMAEILAGGSGRLALPDEIDPNDQPVPLVITYHAKCQKVLRVVAHPYYIYRWPFLDIYFRRVAGRGYSPGLAKRLEHIQAATTAMINQSIDAVTMSNSMKFFTQDPQHRNMKWNPFHPIYVNNVNDIKDVRMSTQVIPDIQLINLMMVFAERIAGISDPGFGRESRMGGHPSPATNVLVQLQEGAKLLGLTLKNVRQQLSTAGEWILNLYQQHEAPGNPRLAQQLGTEDASKLEEALSLPGQLQFDLHALSEATNPDAERNNAVTIFQMTGNFYNMVLRMMSLAANPDPRTSPDLRAGAWKSIEASEIDDPDQYALKLREASEAIASVNQSAAVAEAGAAAQPGGAAQQPPGAVPEPSLASALLGGGEGGGAPPAGGNGGY